MIPNSDLKMKNYSKNNVYLQVRRPASPLWRTTPMSEKFVKATNVFKNIWYWKPIWIDWKNHVIQLLSKKLIDQSIAKPQVWFCEPTILYWLILFVLNRVNKWLQGDNITLTSRRVNISCVCIYRSFSDFKLGIRIEQIGNKWKCTDPYPEENQHHAVHFF